MLGKVAVIVVLLFAVEECDDRGSTRQPEQRPPKFQEAEIESMCTVNVFAAVPHYPHQSKRTPSDMVGKAFLTCSKPIEQATIEVKIQRQIDAGRWVDHIHVPAKCGPFVMAGGTKQVCQATAPCPKDRPDTLFRTAARAEGVHEGKAAGMSEWKASNGVKVPCKQT